MNGKREFHSSMLFKLGVNSRRTIRHFRSFATLALRTMTSQSTPFIVTMTSIC